MSSEPHRRYVAAGEHRMHGGVVRQLLADYRVGRHEAEDVPGHEDPSGLTGDVSEAPHVGQRDRNRFLNQYVLARLESGLGLGGVDVLRGGYHDRVNRRVLYCCSLVARRSNPERTGYLCRAGGVRIANNDEVGARKLRKHARVQLAPLTCSEEGNAYTHFAPFLKSTRRPSK
jgi:hypothetical protein